MCDFEEKIVIHVCLHKYRFCGVLHLSTIGILADEIVTMHKVPCTAVADYEMGRGEEGKEGVRSYVQQITHYDRTANMLAIDVIDIWMYRYPTT